MGKTTLEVPVAIGDTIYRKCDKIIDCRYFGDEYAAKDGTPHCLQHEYDCDPDDNGKACNAKYEYYVEPIKVSNIILADFFKAEIKGKDMRNIFALTKEEADTWIQQKTEEELKRRKEKNMDKITIDDYIESFKERYEYDSHDDFSNKTLLDKIKEDISDHENDGITSTSLDRANFVKDTLYEIQYGDTSDAGDLENINEDFTNRFPFGR